MLFGAQKKQRKKKNIVRSLTDGDYNNADEGLLSDIDCDYASEGLLPDGDYVYETEWTTEEGEATHPALEPVASVRMEVAVQLLQWNLGSINSVNSEHSTFIQAGGKR
jgi:hypothetical protein